MEALDEKDAKVWNRRRDYLSEIPVGGDDDIVSLKRLCRNPEIIFIDLEELVGYAIRPALDPAWDTAPDIDPCQRDTRLDGREGIGSVPRDFGQRVRLGADEARFDVRERLTCGACKRQAEPELADRHYRYELCGFHR